MKYQASKILAHQAPLQFMQEHKSSFALRTLHPTFVLGPSLIQKTEEDLSGPNYMLMGSLGSKSPFFAPGIVHVHDVASAMLATIDAKLETNAEEFIITGDETTWDDIVAFVKSTYPQVTVNLVPPFERSFKTDTGKAERLLGARWKSMQEIVGSVLDQQLKFRNENV